MTKSRRYELLFSSMWTSKWLERFFRYASMAGKPARMHSRKMYTINVRVYSPAPVAKPRMQQLTSPAEVVSPLICPREE